jgi:hypothetical protein
MAYNLDEKGILMDLYSSERLQRLVAEKMLDLFDRYADRVHKINETLRKTAI